MGSPEEMRCEYLCDDMGMIDQASRLMMFSFMLCSVQSFKCVEKCVVSPCLIAEKTVE